MAQILYTDDPFAKWTYGAGGALNEPFESEGFYTRLRFENAASPSLTGLTDPNDGFTVYPHTALGSGYLSDFFSSEGVGATFISGGGAGTGGVGTAPGTLDTNKSGALWFVDDGRPGAEDALDLRVTFKTFRYPGQEAGTLLKLPGDSLTTSRNVIGATPTVPRTNGSLGSGTTSSSISTPTIKPGKIKPAPTGSTTALAGFEWWCVGFKLQANVTQGDTAATVAEDATVDSITDMEGYYLKITTIGPDYWRADADLRITLVHRISTASVVYVAEQVIPAGADFLNLFEPVTVRVETQDINSGTDVEIKAFIGPWDGGGEQQLFNSSLPGTVSSHSAGGYTLAADGTIEDTGAQAQIGHGTIAFGGRLEREITTPTGKLKQADGVISVETRAVGSSVIRWRDEFDRLPASSTPFNELLATTLPIRDRYGNISTSLAAMYTNDRYFNPQHYTGDAQANLIRKLEDDIGTTGDHEAFAVIDLDTSDTGGTTQAAIQRREFVRMVPSESSQAHHRSIEFKMPTQNAPNASYLGGVFELGLILRGGIGAGQFLSGIFAGVSAVTDNTSGAQTSLHIHIGYWLPTSYSAMNQFSFTAVLSQDITAGGIDLFDGDWHTLTFDCHDLPTAPVGAAPLVYKVTLDGGDITWTQDDVQSGSFTFTSSDQAIDTGIPASLSAEGGRAEGFVFQSSRIPWNAGYQVWENASVRNFDQLTLTKPGGSTLDPDLQASIPIATEASAATGNLHDVLCFDFTVAEQRERRATASAFDSGHLCSTPLSAQTRRVWAVQAAAVTDTEIAALRTFWDDHNGMEIPFNWTGYTSSEAGAGTSVTARFVEDAMFETQIAPNVWSVRFTIEEVF